MDPRLRTAVLLFGLAFCMAFGFLTAKVAADTGFDILSLFSFAIIVMLMLAILGAIRHPPDDDGGGPPDA
jgi:hypothetical protein